MLIRNGELYLKKQHIQILKNEPDYVKQRYHSVIVALTAKNNNIIENAVQDLNISMRQFQRFYVDSKRKEYLD